MEATAFDGSLVTREPKRMCPARNVSVSHSVRWYCRAKYHSSEDGSTVVGCGESGLQALCGCVSMSGFVCAQNGEPGQMPAGISCHCATRRVVKLIVRWTIPGGTGYHGPDFAFHSQITALLNGPGVCVCNAGNTKSRTGFSIQLG